MNDTYEGIKKDLCVLLKKWEKKKVSLEDILTLFLASYMSLAEQANLSNHEKVLFVNYHLNRAFQELLKRCLSDETK